AHWWVRGPEVACVYLGEPLAAAGVPLARVGLGLRHLAPGLRRDAGDRPQGGGRDSVARSPRARRARGEERNAACRSGSLPVRTALGTSLSKQIRARPLRRTWRICLPQLRQGITQVAH